MISFKSILTNKKTNDIDKKTADYCRAHYVTLMIILVVRSQHVVNFSRSMNNHMQMTHNNITVELARKPIKHIYLRITVDGAVKVSAPLHCTDNHIRDFLSAKNEWLERHLSVYTKKKSSASHYITGERYFYLGKSYILIVKPANDVRKVVLSAPYLYLFIDIRASGDDRKNTLSQWYRGELKNILPFLIEKWEPIIGVTVNEWRIKKMKTRWGSCNIRDHRIWLNASLIEKPIECLEYVLVHEMVHLLEPSHNSRFHALMTEFMPEWKLYKKRLMNSSSYLI